MQAGTSREAANLTLPTSLHHIPSQHASLQSDEFRQDDFEGFYYDNTGNIIDNEGEPVVFSAGITKTDDQELTDFSRQIKSLGLFYQAVLSGDIKTVDELAEYYERKENDASIPSVIQRLEAVGQYHTISSGNLPQDCYTDLESLDFDEDNADDIADDGLCDSESRTSPWWPYDSKTVELTFLLIWFILAKDTYVQMFMLDLLDSLPRLRLSDDHLKLIIWVMRECGTPNVPSFKVLRKRQDRLTKEMGLESTRHVSALGNEFYANGPIQTFRLVSKP